MACLRLGVAKTNARVLLGSVLGLWLVLGVTGFSDSFFALPMGCNISVAMMSWIVSESVWSGFVRQENRKIGSCHRLENWKGKSYVYIIRVIYYSNMKITSSVVEHEIKYISG